MTAAPDAKPAQQGADDAAAAAPKAARATRGTAAHETNLGTVTVTARRRKESIQDVPVAVSALSGDTIKNNELRVVNDVTKYVPNFTGQSTEGRERPRWFLRGVGSNDPSDLSLADRRVLRRRLHQQRVRAGLPAVRPRSHRSAARPAGTQGKNTVGGALSITSQKPTFDVSGYGKIGRPVQQPARGGRDRRADRQERRAGRARVGVSRERRQLLHEHGAARALRRLPRQCGALPGAGRADLGYRFPVQHPRPQLHGRRQRVARAGCRAGRREPVRLRRVERSVHGVAQRAVERSHLDLGHVAHRALAHQPGSDADVDHRVRRAASLVSGRRGLFRVRRRTLARSPVEPPVLAGIPARIAAERPVQLARRHAPVHRATGRAGCRRRPAGRRRPRSTT